MKIGIDIRSAIHEPAGIGTLTTNLVKQLVKMNEGHEYYLYGDEPFDFGIALEHCISVTKSARFPVVGKLIWHAATVMDSRYRRHLDRFVSIASLQVSALTRDYSVLVIPDLSHILLPQFHVAKSRLAAGLMMKQALIHARRIIAISNHTKSDMIAFMNGRIDDDKISVAHVACDEIYSKTPSALDLIRVRDLYRLPQKYILSVRTLEPRKNYEVLVRAFRECLDEGAIHELVIVGKRGWCYDSIFAEVKKLGLESTVHFLGFVPLIDMPAIYAMADVFVYPSLYEGFGIPPLEAMSCGIPVITSNVSSLPEVVGDAAILIDPGDVRELSSQLKRVLNDSMLRAFYGEAGLRQAQKFSWRSFAEHVLTIVKQ